MYYRVDIIDQYMRFAEAVKIFYFANKCPGLFSLYMKYPSAGEKPAGAGTSRDMHSQAKS
jgi:hypothetical protein